MRFSEWSKTYDAIVAEFGFDPDEDRHAAVLLQPLARPDWEPLRRALAGRTATVVACGPSLAAAGADAFHPPVVAADGATTRLREVGVVPDVVVTDLDGRSEDLLWAAAQGSLLVVHGHGDNKRALHDLAPRLAPVFATCQCDPVGLRPVRNVGGFTDGDRAVLLCEEMGAAGVRLVAFEPEQAPSRYSHRFDPATKGAKLAWARRIVEDAARRSPFTVAW